MIFKMEDAMVTLRNGLKMPLFGLGTSHDGGYNHEAVVYALRDCGYKLIDTAKRYGCEEKLRLAIKDSQVPREEIFITTKLWPTDYGFHSAQTSCGQSMQRLGIDYLDLYLLHWPNCPSTCSNPKLLREETWRALELLYDEGILRSIGVSNFLPCHLEELRETASIIPHVNQIEFHPYQNPIELREYCEDNKIQLEGFCPLAKGRILNEPVIIQTANKYNKTPAQVLIRWSLQNNVVTIPKSTKKQRVLQNSQVFDFNLSNDDMDRLNSLHDDRRCVDIGNVQSKIDSLLPDGYKLSLNKTTNPLTIPIEIPTKI